MTTTATERDVAEQELRHAETEHAHWRREAERQGLDPGQRRAADAQARWYAQQVLRHRETLARLRRS